MIIRIDDDNGVKLESIPCDSIDGLSETAYRSRAAWIAKDYGCDRVECTLIDAGCELDYADVDADEASDAFVWPF